MVQQSEQEYLEAIRGRYRKARREGKTRILDEFCQVCGHHRKHAIRLLREVPRRGRRKPGRPCQYGAAEQGVLEVIWLTANRPCAVRLKAALPVWLPHYEGEYGQIPIAVKERLRTISARTLDRLLTPVRKRYGTRGKCGTRPGSLLRNQIPIKTEHADVTQPGVMEADTVAHCGNSMNGNFVWSLTLTDVFSGWTHNQAVWNKGYEGVKEALADIERWMPFRLTGFHCDNGGEFLNYHLIRYLHERELPVALSRGRPYHKNDTARVEQKNYTHVRLLLGYGRIEEQRLIPTINDLYRTWEYFNNYFSPSLKLIQKTKVGSRYLKTYDGAQTPYHRLMNSPHLNEGIKTILTEQFCNLNPFALKRHIDALQTKILATVR